MPKKTARAPRSKPSQQGHSNLKSDRERLYRAALPHIPFDRFSAIAIARAAKDCGIPLTRAELLFPDPQLELWQYFLTDTNAQLREQLSGLPKKNWKIRDKVAFGVRKKLEILSPYRDIERIAVTHAAKPRYASRAAKNLFDTCDIIWRAAGDTSVDWNFYSKRGLLAAVYSSTLLFWLNDDSENHEDTHQFLSRRIDNVMMIQKIKSILKNPDTMRAGFDFFKKFAA